ncbi:hypothetical protein EUX98_g697 [Antrodiella citrinella]|uniref:SMP-LTD domain-containing protein n=1 Tax=Antrodiella citrinella TaxID=2447956 RepID=A0A4S4NC05_9APHY|nr:hypothetical protein EUX98_g697 [Antrodiella citrinella]
MLDSALNKGNKPPVIADRIEVVELEMGTQPPELEIRDIGELTMDQFRGIFRLTYSGDAHIVLSTKVQANPLNHKSTEIHNLMGTSRGMLAAKDPLVVPMLLRLSHFKLDSYIVLVVSKQKGITLVFKTDPLQNVDINSTFDSIAVIQKFIQKEIEGQLRQMFREDLPGIIHRLSQQWVKAKVEAPYLNKRPPPVDHLRSLETASAPDMSYRLPPRPYSAGLYPQLVRAQTGSVFGSARPRTASVYSASSAGRRPPPSSVSTGAHTPEHSPPNLEGPTSFPHIEQFDPTYGLRPDRIPSKSVFSSFRSLFTPNKGLADLAEEPSDIDDEDLGMYDGSNWDDLLSESHYATTAPPPSESDIDDDVVEYESIPAVGGGSITRPRVIHTQSQVHPDADDSPIAGPSRRPAPPRLSGLSRSYDTMSAWTSQVPHTAASERPPSYNPYFAGATPMYGRPMSAVESYQRTAYNISSPPHMPPLDHSGLRRGDSPSSIRTQPSRSTDNTQSIPTPPHGDDSDSDAGIRISRQRRSSFSSFHTMDKFYTGSPPDSHAHMSGDHDPKIVLKPALNNSISKLSTLSHSNHTLSPYTRTLEHFTVRSVPPRESHSSGSASLAERPPVKAKRKRTYRVGRKSSSQQSDPEAEKRPHRSASVAAEPASPVPPMSDFDASELDRYFRARDDLVPRYPDLHPSHVRRRFPSYQSQA